MKIAAAVIGCALVVLESRSYAADLSGKILRSVKLGGVSGAEVVLKRTMNNAKEEIVGRVTSDKAGNYAFWNLRPGIYTLSSSGELPKDPVCEKSPPSSGPFKLPKGVVSTFSLNFTFDLPAEGRAALNLQIDCED
jgi:hypothetical protein